MSKKSSIYELFERTDANHAKCNECDKELSYPVFLIILRDNIRKLSWHTRDLMINKMFCQGKIFQITTLRMTNSLVLQKELELLPPLGYICNLQHHLPLLILKYQKLQKHRKLQINLVPRTMAKRSY